MAVDSRGRVGAETSGTLSGGSQFLESVKRLSWGQRCGIHPQCSLFQIVLSQQPNIYASVSTPVEDLFMGWTKRAHCAMH